ncbi:unnamed protein product [Taenia asiatica]|uniref:Apple domain-containing protein n=1 Tax=Taenia asiatica TaxID=60517 RepID=A0A0R3W9C6_TAEAS|nr:unnamed protein product [Taenia asiatica]
MQKLNYFLGLLLCLVSITAARQSLYVQNLKFLPPCENNPIDESTGNFKCMVKTGAECFALCQEHGCFEWSFTSFMASTDTQLHQHYRCRIGPTLEPGSGLGLASVAEAATVSVNVGFTHRSNSCLVPGQLVKTKRLSHRTTDWKVLAAVSFGCHDYHQESRLSLYTPTTTINTDPVYTYARLASLRLASSFSSPIPLASAFDAPPEPRHLNRPASSASHILKQTHLRKWPWLKDFSQLLFFSFSFRLSHLVDALHTLLSLLLHLLLFISASYYVHGLKFSRPCENNTYDEMTGNFKCTVPTGAECFQLCQQYGCYEWSFSSFMPSTDTQVRDHFRCRCIQDICLYNYVRARDRDYE